MDVLGHLHVHCEFDASLLKTLSQEQTSKQAIVLK